MGDVLAIRMFWVLKSRESGGRLSCYHTFSYLGIRVKKESQLLPLPFHEFRYSNQGKVEHVSAIIVRFLLLSSLKSREIGGRLSYYHSFPSGLSSQFGRKWRTSQLLSYSFLVLWVLKSREGVSAIITLALLLWVPKSSESGGRLS